MRKLLKYILLSILALIVYDSAKGDSISEGYDHLSEFQVEYALDQETFLSSPRTDICPPRQISTINVPRVQSSGRRHDSSNRQNPEFIKSGRTISTGVDFISRNKSIIQFSSFMQPGHKLISLCRFII